MADASILSGMIPPPALERREGVVVKLASGALGVSVDGNPITARWADPLVVAEGDPVLVDITRRGPLGQGAAVVLCRLSSAPRPGNGTVTAVPASSPTISVKGDDGVTYTAKFVSSYTPTVNDPVTLNWNASIPTVMGKTTTTAAPVVPPPPVVVAPPPPPPTTGSSVFAASDSATFSPQLGLWDAWAGGGGRVYQGNWGGYDLYGAWFYNGQVGSLAGRTITRIQFRIGSRSRVGNYNNANTLHFSAHSSPSRPGGDVARSGGMDYTMQPNQGATTIDLPVSFAGALLGGGGISISGNPYTGIEGRYSQPDSGTLIIDWSR